MTRRPLLSTVYTELFEISRLRDVVRGFADDGATSEAAHFAARLDHLEREALRLATLVERQHNVATH